MKAPPLRWLSQTIYDGVFELTRPGPQAFHRRVARRTLEKLRARMVSFGGDPVVSRVFLGGRISFPLSHNLLLYQREQSGYSMNLARVCEVVLEKYDDLRAIDVGGNIGDSVLIMRRAGLFPILTIEGDPRFYHFLVQNTAEETGLVIERAFVAAEQDEVLTLVPTGGTSRLARTPDAAESAVEMRPLKEIIESHPEFESAKLMKIDADGMDFSIIESAITWVSAARPVLFFEYDPTLARERQVRGTDLLRRLADAGYQSALAWDNNGKFLLGASLESAELFADLEAYIAHPSTVLYWDMCCFHADDGDLFDVLHQRERMLAEETTDNQPGLAAALIPRVLT